MIPDFRIILVNWNLKQDTADCIQSLVEAGAAAEQVIVVDNGSTDGSVDYLQEKFEKRLHLVAADTNLGFAEGVNLGVRTGLEGPEHWFLLINNDTLVSPEFFQQLELAVRDPAGYQIIGAAIYFAELPDRLWYLGDRKLFGSLVTTNPYYRKPLPDGLPAVLPVDFVNGCGMLVHRSVFEKIGLLDPSYYMYGEEVDFCLRAQKAKFILACATRAKMWHKISASSVHIRPKIRYLRVRNQIWIYRRYSAGMQYIFLFLFSIIKGIRTGISDLSNRRFDSFVMLLRGWRDGWLASRM